MSLTLRGFLPAAIALAISFSSFQAQSAPPPGKGKNKAAACPCTVLSSGILQNPHWAAFVLSQGGQPAFGTQDYYVSQSGNTTTIGIESYALEPYFRLIRLEYLFGAHASDTNEGNCTQNVSLQTIWDDYESGGSSTTNIINNFRTTFPYRGGGDVPDLSEPAQLISEITPDQVQACRADADAFVQYVDEYAASYEWTDLRAP